MGQTIYSADTKMTHPNKIKKQKKKVYLNDKLILITRFLLYVYIKQEMRKIK